MLQRDGTPTFFPTPGFDIYIGKVTDLSAVHPDFLFPDKYIVPKDSPEEPNARTNVTCFSFQYVVYRKNVYGWASSTPPSPEYMLITLMAMSGNPERDLFVRDEPDPIRVFASREIPSGGQCLYWDRFAAGTGTRREYRGGTGVRADGLQGLAGRSRGYA